MANTFFLEFKDFFSGFSPAAHLNSLTSIGGNGHASAMTNCDILTPDFLTQGAGLANLTAGTQAGAVSDQINFIMDRAVSADKTYGVSDTLLHEISSTAVTNAGNFPHTITNATDGCSCIELKGNLYTFYNKASGGDIEKFDLSSTFDSDWGSTIPTGAAALQKAIHPVAKKEDTMVFGNGRYLGTYIDATTTLAPTKLDFGDDSEVADVVWHGNVWYLAVNSGITGTNRTESAIYLYDGSATATVLDDETSVGVQRIGFLYVLNGIVYVAYQDLSSTGGYNIGYISGRQIKRIASFTGSLPDYQQKTLYKNTILFISDNKIYSVGAVVDDLPIQISQMADGGYQNVGALAAPFGTVFSASNDGSTNFKLAKFSGYDVTSDWRSIIIPISRGRQLGQIDTITVYTNTIGTGGRADLQLEYDQDSADSGTVKQITGAKRRHIFQNFGGAHEDFRIYLNFANGSQTNNVEIRNIQVNGNYIER